VVGGIHTRAITLMVGNTNCKKLWCGKSAERRIIARTPLPWIRRSWFTATK
jgi:hypothetical protein